MSLTYIATPNLLEAITLINGVDLAKFQKISSKLLQNIHIKLQRTFSDSEIKLLQDSLQLEKDRVTLLVDTIEFLFLECAYYNAKSHTFLEKLEGLGLCGEKRTFMAQIWGEKKRHVVQSIQQQEVAPVQLSDLKWHSGIRMAQGQRNKLCLPYGRLQFSLNSQSEVDEKVCLELSQEKLQLFYNELEKVQQQLDALM